MKKISPTAILLACITAFAALFALGDELYFVVSRAATNHYTKPEAIGRFLSYGTMLTNLLVALNLTIVLLVPNSAAGKFFSKPFIATAIALYILLVFFGYNILLRNLSNPRGWQELDSELLHVVVPLLYFLYWLLYVSKTSLQWKNVLPWLAGPAVYFIYMIIRGEIDGFYPYTIFNIKELGYPRSLLYAGASGLGIIALGLLLIALGRLQIKKVAENKV